VEPYAPPPVEAFLRNGELRLAALIVALVIVPGAMKKVSGATGTPPASEARQGSASRVKRRHVRAPRSC
jgi:hypothetical protein